MKFLLAIVFTLSILLSACGQTGNLVLPPELTEKKTNLREKKQ